MTCKKKSQSWKKSLPNEQEPCGPRVLHNPDAKYKWACLMKSNLTLTQLGNSAPNGFPDERFRTNKTKQKNLSVAVSQICTGIDSSVPIFHIELLSSYIFFKDTTSNHFYFSRIGSG